STMPVLLWISLALAAVASSQTKTTEEDQFLTALYRECWGNCYTRFCNAVDQPVGLFEAVDETFTGQNATDYCGAYRTARTCASQCVPLEHARFLAPFYAKNNLNELICVERNDDFTRVHPCLNGDITYPLSFYYEKCGFPMEGRTREERIVPTQEHCRSFRCVRRYVPHFARERCHGVNTDEAVLLLQEMVDGWLKDRINFRLLERGCRQYEPEEKI
ncbi:hypothetical protein PFISCL1PPCAC_9630, partial [Pristionchus fissidentatus]